MLGNGDGEGGEDASYFVKRSSNKVFGPFDKKTIRLMLRADKIAPEAEVSVDKEDWTPLSSLDAFADMISEASDQENEAEGEGRDSDAQTDVGGGGFNMPSNEPERDPGDDTIPVDSPDFDASFGAGDEGQEAELPRSAQSDDGGAAPSSDDLELPSPKGDTNDEEGEDAPSNLPGLPDSQNDEETALPQSKSTVEGDEDIDLPAPKDDPLAPDTEDEDSGQDDPLAPVSSEDDGNDEAPPLFDDLDEEDDDGWRLPTSKPTTEEEDPDKTRIDRPDPELPASKGQSNLPASGESELPTSTSSEEKAEQTGGTQTDPDAETGDVDLPTSSEPELPASGPPDLPTSGEPELPNDPSPDAPQSKEEFDKGDADVDFSKVDELDEPQREGTPGEGFSDPDLDLTPSAEEYEETTGRSLEEETGKAESSSQTEGSGMFAEDDGDLFGDGDDDLFGPSDDDVFEDEEPLFDEGSDDGDVTSAEGAQGRRDRASAQDSGQDQEDTGEFGEQDLAGDEVEYQGGSGLLELDTPETRSRETDQGIEPDTTEPAEQPEAPAQPAQGPDDSGGSGVLVPMLAVTGLIAAIGAGGWYVYDAFLSDPDVPSASKESTETAPTQPSRASVDPGVATTDVWGDIHPAVERARTGSLEGSDRGELLLLESLLLSRYDAPQIEKHAASLADDLSGQSGVWTKLALGAWEARNGRPDAAKSHLDAADVDGSDTPTLAAYYRDLSLGIAHIKALEKTDSGDDATGSDSTGNGATKDGEAGSTETDPEEKGTAPVRETATTQAEDDHIAAADEALASARSAADDRAAPLFWKARGRERTGQDETALSLYQDAINRQPNHVASRLGAARLLYARGDLKGVSKHAEKILSELGAPAAPAETAEAYHLIGLVHVARSEYTAAIESFTKSINQGEYRPVTLEALASAYESAGQYQEALNFFKSNKLGEENPAVILGLVRSHIGLENWQEAINALERGEKLFPNDARFPFYLGQLNRERGAFSDARRAMRRAVQIDPGLMEAYGILAQLAWRLEEDVNEAEGYVSRVVEQPDALTADAAREVAEYYRMRGERALAAQWYQAALDRNPNAWRAKLALAELRLKSRETDAALELLEGARESGVENKQLSLHLADAYRQAGQYDRALKEINKVVGKQSENPRHLFTRGMIHFDRGNYETARRDFNKAYELAPRFHRAYFYVGRCAFERGDSKNAMKIFRHVLDYKPKNGEFRYWMGRAFEDQSRLEEALSEYEKAIKFDETYVAEHPRVLVESGRLKVKLNQPSTGIEQIRRALEIAPGFRPALLALGEAYFATEQYEDAIGALRRALEDDPDAAQAQRTLGMAYIYTERRRQGAQHLQKAVKFGYDDPDIYKTLGYVYKELGEDRLAVDAFKSFLRESKDQQVPETTRREMLRQIQQLGG